MVSDFPYHTPSGSEFFPFREVPILKRGAIEESLLVLVVSLCCA